MFVISGVVVRDYGCGGRGATAPPLNFSRGGSKAVSRVFGHLPL